MTGRIGKGEDRVCRLISLEYGEFELRPGDAIRCGRHKDNDIRMQDDMVSRFHARFTWDKEMERPVVFDNGSQNGTSVDGEKVRTAVPLTHDSRVTIGPYVVKVDLQGCPEIPAILRDTGDLVTLFSDVGPNLDGKAPDRHAVKDLLSRLERERRTGTVKMKLAVGGRAVLTLCLGRLMAAEVPDGSGLRAIEIILRSPGAEYTFSNEIEPREEALNLWFSDYLRSRESQAPRTAKKSRNHARP